MPFNTPFKKNNPADKIIFEVGQEVCLTTEAFLDAFYLTWPLGAGDPSEGVRTMKIREVKKAGSHTDDYDNYFFFGNKYTKRSWSFYEIESYGPVIAKKA